VWKRTMFGFMDDEEELGAALGAASTGGGTSGNAAGSNVPFDFFYDTKSDTGIVGLANQYVTFTLSRA
jgi:hypothetical protein